MNPKAFLLSFLLLVANSCREEPRPQDRPRDDDTTLQRIQETQPSRPAENGGPYSLPELDTASGAPLSIDVFRVQGELMLYDSLLQQSSQLTATGGNIDTFFLSPTRHYVACHKMVEIVDMPGEYEPNEEPPKVRIHSILVINIPERRIIREIQPTDWKQNFYKWISKSKFLFLSGGAFDVSGHYVYDVFRDSVQQLPYGAFE